MASSNIAKLLTMDEVLARIFPNVGTLAHGASMTLTFSGFFNGIIFGFHGSSPGPFFALQIGATSAHCAHKFLNENVPFAVSETDNKMTITNNAQAGTATLRVLCFEGPNAYTIS